MSKTVMVRLFWDILMMAFFLGFVLALVWYTTGSLETMPTEEQQEKAEMAAILSMLMSGIPCMICGAVRRQIK